MNDDLQKLYQQWQLSNVRSFAHRAIPHNYVVIAYSNQYKQDVVLKIGPKKVIDQEIKALQYFQGDGCVKLLAKIMDVDYKLEITVALVSQLIAEQFPQWADLPIRPVAVSGWDNRTFHLGDTISNSFSSS